MLTISLQVSSIWREIQTVLAQLLLTLVNLSSLGRARFTQSRLLPVVVNRAFILSKFLPVGSVVLGIARGVAVLIAQLGMIFTEGRLVVRDFAQCASRFWGSLTEFSLGEDSLGGDRSASEHRHRHAHLDDMSVPHARSFSLDRDLLDVPLNLGKYSNCLTPCHDRRLT